MSKIIEELERAQLRDGIPQFKAGDTVRVHFQVIEGERRRLQVFEGIVIKRQGAGVRETFTVRKQSFGVGVERTFPVHSPKIEKIEVGAVGDVNRAKLYYRRGRVGKKARIREIRQDRSKVVAAEPVPQVPPDQREELYRGVVGCAERVVVRVVPADEIDRRGLHRSNLDAMRAILHTLTPPAEACLVDGFRLGASAPEHTAVVDGDTKSAAIAAASIVAKVTRDRLMRRMDALFPQYGFSSHVGYITPSHTRIVIEQGPSPIHRRSWRARCYAELERIASA